MTADLDPEELDELAHAAKAGDELAFDALVERVFRRVYRWALVRIGDPDDADDVTQRVLLRLHSRLSTWEGRSRFTTWLFRITVNEASSWSRRATRRARRLAGHESRPAAVGSPDEADDVRRLVDLAIDLLARLPRRQREVLDLVDFQGYAPKEAAEMLRMNPATLRANLFKARRSLREKVLDERPDALELLP